ncbi:MAG: NepR family anti-sigma factor [Pseudomonadota bacterium]
MSSGSFNGDQSPDQAENASGSPRPDWADGLRQLYDSVVDEPLPDAFKDLLDKLDDGGSDDEDEEADGSDGSPC